MFCSLWSSTVHSLLHRYHIQTERHISCGCVRPQMLLFSMNTLISLWMNAQCYKDYEKRLQTSIHNIYTGLCFLHSVHYWKVYLCLYIIQCNTTCWNYYVCVRFNASEHGCKYTVQRGITHTNTIYTFNTQREWNKWKETVHSHLKCSSIAETTKTKWLPFVLFGNAGNNKSPMVTWMSQIWWCN